MSKIDAWEQVKKDNPNVKIENLSEWEKQQIVRTDKHSGQFSFDGYCYTVNENGTYSRYLIPNEVNLKT